MILASEGNIDAISLPEEIREFRNSHHVEATLNDGEPGGDFLVSRHELEEDYIRTALAATGNNKTQAANPRHPSHIPAAPPEVKRTSPGIVRSAFSGAMWKDSNRVDPVRI